MEESDERYELQLAIGLLQWIDNSGVRVRRHLFTAPADVEPEPTRGVLVIKPADSFERFRLELDMLEPQDQPKLTKVSEDNLVQLLEELDIAAWDKGKVAPILHMIAHLTSAEAQVDEDAIQYAPSTTRQVQVRYAPAIVLREKRGTAYQELIGQCQRLLSQAPSLPTSALTAVWKCFLQEGVTQHAPREADAAELLDGDTRMYFPLPVNDEQRMIVQRLSERPYVLVKGPPGTGKSHTIANLICHLLAKGQKVLVTAHTPRALMVLRDLLPREIQSLCVTTYGSSFEDRQLLTDARVRFWILAVRVDQAF